MLDFSQYNSTFKNSENCIVEFIFKGGCDDSFGHNEYQQAFFGNENEMEFNVLITVF